MQKLIKIVSILLIISMLCINIPTVYALRRPPDGEVTESDEGNGRPQFGPPFNDDEMDGVPTTDPSTRGYEERTETINSYEWIKGNVYEDLGEQYDAANGETGGTDSHEAGIPIENVLVKCTDGSGNSRIIKTDPAGNWSLNVDAYQTYQIEYYYGKIYEGALEELSNEQIKNIIKYNGVDYLVSKISGKTNVIDGYTVDRYEVTQSGTGVTQVMLMLDCSTSMRNEYMKSDGTQKTKLQVAVDATKSLISQLLNSKNNIYIGLVFFSGKNYRAVSLTKNKEELVQALDDILNNNWWTSGTNITSALDKAMNSFYTEANRHIIIVSDGYPTKANKEDGSVVQLYSDDSEEEFETKLRIMADLTKEKLKSILEEGEEEKKVNIISLMTLPDETQDDRETRDLVKYIFDLTGYENNMFKMVSDSSIELDDMIRDDIKVYIEKHSEGNIKTDTEYTPAIGYEDQDRYKRAIENFKIWDLKNVNLFKLIEAYDGTQKEDVKNLSDMSYGYAIGGDYSIGKQYIGIDSLPDDIEYRRDPETGERRIIKITHYIINHTGYEEDMGLAKRPAFSLGLDVEATRMEVTLSNGSQYVDKQRKFGSDDVLITTLEDKLAYGSEIEVTFTERIKNESKMPYDKIQIICYLPKYVEKIQGDYPTEIKSIESLMSDGYISQEQYNEYKDTKIAALITLEFGEDNINETVNSYDCRLKCSMRIKSLEDVEDLDCIAEIYSYSNYFDWLEENDPKLTSRRSTQKTYDGFDVKEISISPASDIRTTAEMDWAESDALPIVPPTGLSNKMILKNKIIKYSLIILITLATIIIIALYVRKKKNKK